MLVLLRLIAEGLALFVQRIVADPTEARRRAVWDGLWRRNAARRRLCRLYLLALLRLAKPTAFALAVAAMASVPEPAEFRKSEAS